jgi:hypothetical protein
LKNLGSCLFFVKNVFVVLIVRLNPSIRKCVLHDLVSIAVKDRKCVVLVAAHFEHWKHNCKIKYAIRRTLVH